MFRLFSRNKSIQAEKEKLFNYLEKIVNITLVKAERAENETVKQTLEDLNSIFNQFWNLKKDNPDKFETYLWSSDFYENYIRKEAQELDSDDTKAAKADEKLREEAGLRLMFRADEELKGLTQFLNSFKKIWEVAFKAQNEEISRYAVYHIIQILRDMTEEPGNGLFVEQVLGILKSITWQALKSPISGIDLSVQPASIHWYTDLVFTLSKDRPFDLEYLELFNRNFFISIKYIVDEGNSELFSVMVSNLVDGIKLRDYNSGKIWEYESLLWHSSPENYPEIEKKDIHALVSELSDTSHEIVTKQELDEWLIKFDQLKSLVEPHFSKDYAEQVKEIEEDIKDFVIGQYKYNRLLNIVFSIGAYCLFKKRYDLIKLMWEYKQPPDSDAHWVGHNIVPETIEKLMSFLFRTHIVDSRIDFWEGHHGSSSYVRMYSLLLMARIIKNLNPDTNGKYPQLRNYNIPINFDEKLSSIKYFNEKLLSTVEALKERKNLLPILGFDRIDEILDNNIVPFLKEINNKAEKRLKKLERDQALSAEKVKEFKEFFQEAFNKSVTARNIFQHYKLYEDHSTEKPQKEMPRFGINRIEDKAAFFEKWHVSYSDWGKFDGEQLAAGEDQDIARKMASYCETAKDISFEKILERFNDLSQVIIIASETALYDYFYKQTNFSAKWRNEKRKLSVKGFEGWYSPKGGKDIPVFIISFSPGKSEILILNTSKLGKLVQLSPLDEGESEDLRNGIFFMDIQAFSENDKLVKEFLDNPPKWLKDIGDEEAQTDFLNEKALIKIFERFELKKHDEFEGYLFKSKN